MVYTSPLTCFPALSHWIQAADAGHWQLEAWENFVKSTDRNRYWLHSHQDMFRMSLPIAGGRSQKTLIQQVQLDQTTNWRAQHLAIIRNAYAASPFFEDLFPEIETCYLNSSNNLFEFNMALFQYCREWVCPTLAFSFSKEWQGPYENLEVEMEVLPYYRPFPLKNQSDLSRLSILDLLFQLGPWSEIWLEDAVKFYRTR